MTSLLLTGVSLWFSPDFVILVQQQRRWVSFSWTGYSWGVAAAL